MKKVLGILGAVAVAGAASAQIDSIEVVQVDQTAVDGVVVNDVLLSYTGQLTGVQLKSEFEAGGGVYQDAFGVGIGAPNGLFFPTVPALEFDTFVALGGRDSASADLASPGVAGGAVNIDPTNGDRVESFSDTAIDIAYFPPGTLVLADNSDYFVARITLTEATQGTFDILASANNVISDVNTFQVVDGAIVPEPATAALLGLGGLAMLRRRSA